MNKPNNSDTDRPDPPTAPGIIGILLSEHASKRLLQAGECFKIAARASYPSEPNRVALYLAPIPLELAALASGVILGTHKAVRIKPRHKPTSCNHAATDTTDAPPPAKESFNAPL